MSSTFPTATTRRRHVWRETAVDVFRCSDEAWRLQAEAEAIGYATELAEFAAEHPRPTFKGVLLALAQPAKDDQELDVGLAGREAA